MTSVKNARILSRDKLSTFFITLNTNETNYSAAKLRQASELWIENFKKYLKFNHPNKSIQRIEIPEASVSKGPKVGRIHLHMLIKVYHQSNIQIDCIKTRKFFQKELGLSSLHFSVKFIKDPTFRLQLYVRRQHTKR